MYGCCDGCGNDRLLIQSPFRLLRLVNSAPSDEPETSQKTRDSPFCFTSMFGLSLSASRRCLACRDSAILKMMPGTQTPRHPEMTSTAASEPSSSPLRAVVIGGSGQLGCWLLWTLAQRGHSASGTYA